MMGPLAVMPEGFFYWLAASARSFPLVFFEIILFLCSQFFDVVSKRRIVFFVRHRLISNSG